MTFPQVKTVYSHDIAPATSRRTSGGKSCSGSRSGRSPSPGIKYAHDYNKSVAYLVVFNMTEKLLQFPTDGPAGDWTPYVELGGVRVYYIGVRVHPGPTPARPERPRQ